MPARVTVTLLLFCVERACTRRNYPSWRRQRDEIAKVGMTSRKRGRKAKAEDPRVKELERENARLQRRLARVETMLEIQKKNLRTTGDPPESTRERRERLIVAAEELAGRIGQTAEACEALGVARSTLYRRRQPVDAQTEASSSAAPSSRRKLSARKSSGPCTVSGSSTRRPASGVGYASGRGNLPLLDSHDVSDFGGARRGPRAPEPTAPSERHQARSCWPKRRTRFGRGISRSFVAPSSGPTTTSTSSSTSSPATWLAGCWLTEKVPRSPNASSPRAVASRTLNPTSSPFTRTVAAR